MTNKVTPEEENPSTEKSLVMVDDYSDKIVELKKESFAKNLPTQASSYHGCYSCEWKGTFRCPYGFKIGKGRQLRKNMHSSGICQLRKWWLISLYSGKKERPNYLEWVKCYNKVVGYLLFQEDRTRLEQIDTQLKKLIEDNASQEEIDKHELLRKSAHEDYLSIWKELRKFEEAEERRKLEAEKIKQGINIISNIMTPLDIHNAMRINKPKKVVDAEFSEVKEND